MGVLSLVREKAIGFIDHKIQPSKIQRLDAASRDGGATGGQTELWRESISGWLGGSERKKGGNVEGNEPPDGWRANIQTRALNGGIRHQER